MNLLSHIIVALLVNHAFFFAVGLAAATGKKLAEQEVVLQAEPMNNTLSLQFLGVVENKFFFANSSIRTTWFEAGKHCQSFNLSLASIETLTQKTFLAEAIRNIGGGEFWTSARESRQYSMMAWNGTGAALDRSVIGSWTFWGSGSPYYYCGTLLSTTSYAVRCTDSYKVLCEAKFNQNCDLQHN